MVRTSHVELPNRELNAGFTASMRDKREVKAFVVVRPTFFILSFDAHSCIFPRPRQLGQVYSVRDQANPLLVTASFGESVRTMTDISPKVAENEDEGFEMVETGQAHPSSNGIDDVIENEEMGAEEVVEEGEEEEIEGVEVKDEMHGPSNGDADTRDDSGDTEQSGEDGGVKGEAEPEDNVKEDANGEAETPGSKPAGVVGGVGKILHSGLFGSESFCNLFSAFVVSTGVTATMPV